MKSGLFSTTKLFFCLAALASLCSGCVTSQLWSERDCVVPSPTPNLKLSAVGDDVLVEYDRLCEDTGAVQRRSYLLKPYLERSKDCTRKPAFINPAKVGNLEPIPVVLGRPESNAPIVATISTNGASFTVYRNGQQFGPYDLPVYRDARKITKQVLLTAPAITADVSLVAGVVSIVMLPALDGLSWSPDGWSWSP